MLKRRDSGFPLIMGVINVTPDSFHEGSRAPNLQDVRSRALRMSKEGADWIDVGGESTRPGSKSVSQEEELARVVPAIECIRDELPDICISVDTRRSLVARESLDVGADMDNDVSLWSDPGMIRVISDYDCPICLMHMKGLPENMQYDPQYDDVVSEVRDFLYHTTSKLTNLGIEPSRLVVDPGIGFGKKLEHNLELLSSGRNIMPNQEMSLMWGVSRKSMFGDLLGRKESDERLSGTLGIAARSPEKGVDIVRVHDVVEHKDLFSAMESLR